MKVATVKTDRAVVSLRSESVCEHEVTLCVNLAESGVNEAHRRLTVVTLYTFLPTVVDSEVMEQVMQFQKSWVCLGP